MSSKVSSSANRVWTTSGFFKVTANSICFAKTCRCKSRSFWSFTWQHTASSSWLPDLARLPCNIPFCRKGIEWFQHVSNTTSAKNKPGIYCTVISSHNPGISRIKCCKTSVPDGYSNTCQSKRVTLQIYSISTVELFGPVSFAACARVFLSK